MVSTWKELKIPSTSQIEQNNIPWLFFFSPFKSSCSAVGSWADSRDLTPFVLLRMNALQTGSHSGCLPSLILREKYSFYLSGTQNSHCPRARGSNLTKQSVSDGEGRHTLAFKCPKTTWAVRGCTNSTVNSNVLPRQQFDPHSIHLQAARMGNLKWC